MIESKEYIIHFDSTTGIQHGSQDKKALKLFQLGCVKPRLNYINQWLIAPIKGYNTSTYFVQKDKEWSCNCQWWNKNHAECSHIKAVKIFLKGGLI